MSVGRRVTIVKLSYYQLTSAKKDFQPFSRKIKTSFLRFQTLCAEATNNANPLFEGHSSDEEDYSDEDDFPVRNCSLVWFQ